MKFGPTAPMQSGCGPFGAAGHGYSAPKGACEEAAAALGMAGLGSRQVVEVADGGFWRFLYNEVAATLRNATGREVMAEMKEVLRVAAGGG